MEPAGTCTAMNEEEKERKTINDKGLGLSISLPRGQWGPTASLQHPQNVPHITLDGKSVWRACCSASGQDNLLAWISKCNDFARTYGAERSLFLFWFILPWGLAKYILYPGNAKTTPSSDNGRMNVLVLLLHQCFGVTVVCSCLISYFKCAVHFGVWWKV